MQIWTYPLEKETSTMFFKKNVYWFEIDLFPSERFLSLCDKVKYTKNQ